MPEPTTSEFEGEHILQRILAETFEAVSPVDAVAIVLVVYNFGVRFSRTLQEKVRAEDGWEPIEIDPPRTIEDAATLVAASLRLNRKRLVDLVRERQLALPNEPLFRIIDRIRTHPYVEDVREWHGPREELEDEEQETE